MSGLIWTLDRSIGTGLNGEEFLIHSRQINPVPSPASPANNPPTPAGKSVRLCHFK